MRFGVNSPERKPNSNFSVYFKCVIAAIVLAVAILWLTIGLKHLGLLIIEYWYIVLGCVAFLLVLKYVFKKYKKKPEPQFPLGYYPQQMYEQ